MSMPEKNTTIIHAASYNGGYLSAAWNNWIASPEGQNCLDTPAKGEYLKNRLWWAFMKGAEEAIVGSLSFGEGRGEVHNS